MVRGFLLFFVYYVISNLCNHVLCAQGGRLKLKASSKQSFNAFVQRSQLGRASRCKEWLRYGILQLLCFDLAVRIGFYVVINDSKCGIIVSNVCSHSLAPCCPHCPDFYHSVP